MPNPVLDTNAPRATILIRLLVGGVFLAEGIQKFLFPAALGVGRFIKLGIPAPQLFAPFVGVVEIVCGAFLIIGLFARLATIPLIIDISVAIVTTKIPMLSRAHSARIPNRLLHAWDWCFFFWSAAGPSRSINGESFKTLGGLDRRFCNLPLE